MTNVPVDGVFAAVLTPRKQGGELDEEALRHHLLFLVQAGIDGVALNGATGEFCLTTSDELDRMLRIARETIGSRTVLVAGIGAPDSAHAIGLGKVAIKAGAQGLLLPMPYFFRYNQDDLEAFASTVSAAIEGPIVLYNLPQFATGLTAHTTIEIIQRCDNVVGLKDSSGSLDILRTLTEEGVPACRIVGNDGVLAAARQASLCDGVVSGVACILPELVRALFDECTNNGTRVTELQALLEQFIAQLDLFPTPWGLKIMGEARKLSPAIFHQPLSPKRIEQKQLCMQWFGQNFDRFTNVGG